ncbi:MAG TPA: DUF6600 domain-containing protein, partial [Candidatus Sulfobium mesophilum]|nr:DUF6600 domain-containing protein [Candidatus Sulfobium mesophilum]
VEMQLNTGTYIRLDQNSALQILSLSNDSWQFYLSQGHANIYHRAPKGVIQIDTPDVSARAFDSAVFRLEMSDEYQYTDVSVYKGYVEAENQAGRTRVSADQTASIGQNTNVEIAPIGPSDEWERWNKSRNDMIRAKKGASSRYLPSELGVYASDFDAGGRWVDVPDYGYCWTPTLAVGVTWAPYREGRWIWRGGDYVWVSYDPWGWAPYHYGRWAFAARIGWVWVPPARGDVYWGPGYVGWVRTGDYVAWVPLAPGELYYGRGYYGRHSVNIVNVNVNQVNVTNVYKNVTVNNGVTVVNRNTFATASPRIVNVNKTVLQQQVFTKNNMSVGAPAIKPTRESFFASAKQISPAKLPPQPVRSVQVQQLKQSRPLTKDPGKSVFNPGVQPKQLPLSKVSTPRTPGKVLPSVKPVQPQEPGKTGFTGGLAPRAGKEQVKPIEKKPEVAPTPKVERAPARQLERKPAPEATPPRVEKGPLERKPVAPAATPPPKVERAPSRQFERKPAPEATPTPKVERAPGRQLERKPAPAATPPPKVERAPARQLERKPAPETAPITPTPKVERTPGRQLERKPAPEATPTPKVERAPAKQLERKPTPEATPPPKVERTPGRQLERKPAPEAPQPPKMEQEKGKPSEKRDVAPERGQQPRGVAPKAQPTEKPEPKAEEKPQKDVPKDVPEEKGRNFR